MFDIQRMSRCGVYKIISMVIQLAEQRSKGLIAWQLLLLLPSVHLACLFLPSIFLYLLWRLTLSENASAIAPAAARSTRLVCVFYDYYTSHDASVVVRITRRRPPRQLPRWNYYYLSVGGAAHIKLRVVSLILWRPPKVRACTRAAFTKHNDDETRRQMISLAQLF